MHVEGHLLPTGISRAVFNPFQPDCLPVRNKFIHRRRVIGSCCLKVILTGGKLNCAKRGRSRIQKICLPFPFWDQLGSYDQAVSRADVCETCWCGGKAPRTYSGEYKRLLLYRQRSSHFSLNIFFIASSLFSVCC